MKSGRKNMKRAAEQELHSLEEGESIMQVVSLRGSNLIEVMDSRGKTSLAIFPAKFQGCMWIKRGGFVIIDERGRDMALESGSKVACMVSQVLFPEQVRELRKSPEWPDIFRTATSDNCHSHMAISENAEQLNSSDDDELPPLEANLNRIRPSEYPSESESDSDSDSDTDSEPVSLNSGGLQSIVDNSLICKVDIP